jgi:hypothetical protein
MSLSQSKLGVDLLRHPMHYHGNGVDLPRHKDNTDRLSRAIFIEEEYRIYDE